MRFLADECAFKTTVELLRALGHEVETVWRTPLSGADDDILLARATAHAQLFLTTDSDFANIRRYPPRQARGIVWLKIANDTEAAVHRVLQQLLHERSRDELDRALTVVDRQKYRVVRPEAPHR